MINQSTSRNIWTAAAASAFFVTKARNAQQVSAAPPEHLSHRVVKELLATTKEPQDHLRMTNYCKDEAVKLAAVPAK